MFKKSIDYINQRRTLKYGIGVGIGALLGFLYYFFIGCNSGTCPLTSNPLNSTMIGAVMGFIWVFSPAKSTKEQ